MDSGGESSGSGGELLIWFGGRKADAIVQRAWAVM